MPNEQPDLTARAEALMFPVLAMAASIATFFG